MDAAPRRQADIQLRSAIAVVCPQHGEIGTAQARDHALQIRRKHWQAAHSQAGA